MLILFLVFHMPLGLCHLHLSITGLRHQNTLITDIFNLVNYMTDLFCRSVNVQHARCNPGATLVSPWSSSEVILPVIGLCIEYPITCLTQIHSLLSNSLLPWLGVYTLFLSKVLSIFTTLTVTQVFEPFTMINKLLMLRVVFCSYLKLLSCHMQLTNVHTLSLFI